MKRVNNILVCLLFLLPLYVKGQKAKDKLIREQERLEKNIVNTRNLLDKTKSNAEATLNELKLIESQVRNREELLINFDNQIRSTELKIARKNQEIAALEKKLSSLREQYRKLTIYAYKHRSNHGKMMFVFSSTNYYEAVKRKKYLEKIAEIQRKQKLIILQHKKLIHSEKKSLVAEKDHKVLIVEEKRKEKDLILVDKQKQQKTLQKLKSEEEKLLARIRKDEEQRAQVKIKIDAEIAKEVAASNKKASSAKKTSSKKPGSSGSSGKTPDKKLPEFSESVEMELNSQFENNKGRLPMPVERGAITESYGKHPHPTLPNVFTHNNGVDISAPKGASVRSVFDGEVSSVFSIPGAGMVVIIKHGNYRTVYSNLETVSVSEGSSIKTRQSIGSLKGGTESVSVAHFEIHQVIGSQVNRINPGLWLAH